MLTIVGDSACGGEACGGLSPLESLIPARDVSFFKPVPDGCGSAAASLFDLGKFRLIRRFQHDVFMFACNSVPIPIS